MEAELRPRRDLEQLLQGAEPAGEGHEPVGQLVHQGLALVHRADDPQVGEAVVGDLPVGHVLGDDADHLAAGVEHGVGDLAHEADLPPP